MKTQLADPCSIFRHELRVRYVECDAQGIVFNAHYFTYFDVAMTEFWRELIPGGYSTLTEAGSDMVVAEARARYCAPARFDEELVLRVVPTHVGTTSLTIELEVTREDALLVEGHLRYVFVDLLTTLKRPISPAIRTALVRALPAQIDQPS